MLGASKAIEVEAKKLLKAFWKGEHHLGEQADRLGMWSGAYLPCLLYTFIMRDRMLLGFDFIITMLFLNFLTTACLFLWT